MTDPEVQAEIARRKAELPPLEEELAGMEYHVTYMGLAKTVRPTEVVEPKWDDMGTYYEGREDEQTSI